MNEGFAHAISLVAGIVMGIYYFGGLWFTVRSLPGAEQPLKLLFWSFLARSLPIFAVIWFAAKMHVTFLFFILAGFFLVRFCITRKIRPLTSRQ